MLRTIIWIIASTVLLQACSGSGGGGGGGGNVPPVASVIPAVLPLSNGQDVVIFFSKTMNTGSVLLGGTLTTDPYTPVWSMTASTDDTLTLTPNTNWSIGEGVTLTVDGNDIGGTPMAMLNVAFNVLAGTVYYVNNSATDDSGDGLSPATAKQTINAAIQQSVTDTNNPASVVINAGTYTVNSAAGTDTHVVLVEEVSLYGGYSMDFTDREPAVHISTVQDTSADIIGSFTLTPNRAMEAGTGNTSATIVDGLILNGTSAMAADYGAGIAIINSADVSVQNCVFNGGEADVNYGGWIADAGTNPVIDGNTLNGGNGTTSYGLFVRNGASPTVQSNTFNGGSGSTSTFGAHNLNTGTNPQYTGNTINGGGGVESYGLGIVANAMGMVSNNTITGGSGSSNSYAMIVATNATPTIQGNTINGGTGGSISYGIRINNSGMPTIQQNTSINGGTSTDTYAISIDGAASTAVIQQNTLINGGTATNSSHGIVGSGGATLTIQQNADIDGGSSQFSYAILVSGANPASVIHRNRIFGGLGSVLSFAIDNRDASVRVDDNLIHGGTSNNSHGISVNAANSTLRNNTIYAGGTGNSVGIRTINLAAPVIENNIVYTRTAGLGTCIFKDSTGADPAVIANNNFSGCTDTVFRDFDAGCTGNGDGDADSDTCSLADMEGLSVNYQNNTADDATLVFVDENGADDNFNTIADNNWHLNTATGNIADGGLNGIDAGGWGFTVDFDGVARPAAASGNWAMGAYEHP